jgi:hypothetical protein
MRYRRDLEKGGADQHTMSGGRDRADLTTVREIRHNGDGRLAVAVDSVIEIGSPWWTICSIETVKIKTREGANQSNGRIGVHAALPERTAKNWHRYRSFPKGERFPQSVMGSKENCT